MSFLPLFLNALLLCLATAFQGDLTYYDPSVGLTACGTRHSSSEFIAALSFADFINTPNPNNSPSCHKCALIRNSAGASARVRIKDKCAGCKSGDIDVTSTVFRIFAPLSVGRIRVSWEYVPCTGPVSTNAAKSNYCGTNYANSLSCSKSCPGGVDSECPSGQRCFANVPCGGSTPTKPPGNPKSNYCGVNYAGSLACRNPCPGGLDGDCPPGQRCFTAVPC